MGQDGSRGKGRMSKEETRDASTRDGAISSVRTMSTDGWSNDGGVDNLLHEGEIYGTTGFH